jgi:hypothetical protein
MNICLYEFRRLCAGPCKNGGLKRAVPPVNIYKAYKAGECCPIAMWRKEQEIPLLTQRFTGKTTYRIVRKNREIL